MKKIYKYSLPVQEKFMLSLPVGADIIRVVDRYDLAGNTHNYLLDYDWPLRPRSLTRNVPQALL